MEKYDIIVVGAGPTGLSFASHIKDKSVLVLDKKKTLGSPVKSSAGTFTDAVEEFDLHEAVLHSCKGFRIILDNGFTKEFSYDEPVLHTLDFRKMESILAKRVRNNCELLHPATVEDVVIENGIVKEVKTNEASYKADIFVDASGEARVILKHLNPGYYKKQVLAHGIEYEASDLDLNPDYFDLFFGNKLIPEGYGWVFPTGANSGRLGLGKIIYGTGGRKKVNLENALTRFIFSSLMTAKGLKESNIQEKHGGVMTYYKPLSKSFFKNCFVLGDAASHSSAFLGEGIRFSLKSGKNLAIALNSYGLEEAKLHFQEYMDELTRWFSFFRIFAISFNWFPNWGIHALVKALFDYDKKDMLRIVRSEFKGSDFLKLLYTFPKNLIRDRPLQGEM